MSSLFKKILFLSFVCIFPAQHLWAQTVSSIKKDEILDKLAKLEKMEFENYEQAVFDLSQAVLVYSELRKKECLGEFSTLEINNEGESITKKNKLSKEEKKLCQIELLNFRKKYVKNIYSIRLKHLKEVQQKQIQEISSMRDESLNELDTILQKIR